MVCLTNNKEAAIQQRAIFTLLDAIIIIITPSIPLLFVTITSIMMVLTIEVDE
jgi:hypothetical protein